jgi:hypothetical protein
MSQSKNEPISRRDPEVEVEPGAPSPEQELRATLEQWLKCIPDFALKAGTHPIYETRFLRSMRQLHLVW